MPLIRNTLVFLDTRFFKNYKLSDSAYRKLLEFSRDDKIRLCTSYICIEEWRTQKVSHLSKALQDMRHRLDDLQRTNFIANNIINHHIDIKFPDDELIIKQSKEGIKQFVNENNVQVYKPKEKHICSTWDAYFKGQPPFKEVKNRKDIPDAWILESARDSLAEELHKNADNKFCIGEDNALSDALNQLNFETITVLELVERLEKEEAGVAPETEAVSTEILADTENKAIQTEEFSPLDALLSKAINTPSREIYLRLLGFVVPLDTPTHDTLIEAVASKGFDRKLIKACAVILSDESKPYIKDTGSHYIIGNKEICRAAADRLIQEIIDMLEQG
ncbi:MAG: DUF4935 domain-containing protein [Sedimentisphaerales bacterium]|nr:DUF4935 domain-containing protein [Sedimentisphaerales bacterium]